MSSKPRSRIADYLVYLVVRIVVCVVQTLSFEAACDLARLLARLAYRLDRRHRQVAIENVRLAFPGEMTPEQVDRLVRKVYEHFCRMVIELAHFPRRMHVNNWKRYVDMSHGRPLAEALLCGRPLLIVSGHFGNWEIAGYGLGLLGFTTHAIARPIDNPYLDDYLRAFRERTGQKTLAKHGDFDRMEQVLTSGGVLATLADQDAGQRGLFVDFFGRPASTHKAVALLAMEHRVPMLVIGAPRLGDRYVVCPCELIDPAEYENSPNAARAITERFTKDLERLIRLAPEQYFWLHRRWKHQPLPRKSKPSRAA
jgi:KDO2-lipid IV(A) lauroyltransferase